MNVERAPENPSPLAGEVAARSAAGEGRGDEVVLGGVGSHGPSPGRPLRVRPSSPARGEGKTGAGTSSVSPMMRRRAQVLRLRLTNAERKLWYALRDRRFAGSKFRRQVPVGPFIADFVCFEERLVVEVDGGQHADSMQDQRRDRWFAENGFRVLRFWNNEVLRNVEGVMTVLAQALKVEWS
ncbi:MAG TPA: endonuclease domain-containing protein [Xanthobacteraceae bacterium]